jgi:hypothetical protein
MRHAALLSGVLLAGIAAVASAEPWGGGEPVRFEVARGDATVFYATRTLRYGDRFEVKAHKLHDSSVLVVVPCLPNCERPDFAYAYHLSSGNQQLQIPSTGHYFFWVESDHIGGKGIAWRYGVRRQPLAVREAHSSDDLFTATLDEGVELSVRTLAAHPLGRAADVAGIPAAAEPVLLSRPLQ